MIRSLGHTRQYLGIGIQRYADGFINLGRPADFNLILGPFRMQDAQPVSTPLDLQVRLDGIAENCS